LQERVLVAAAGEEGSGKWRHGANHATWPAF